MDFSGRVVMVTGAGRGSGKRIAERFLERGAVVMAADLTAPDWTTEYEDRLYRTALDVSDEKSVIEAVKKVNAETEGISILINNAGIAMGGPIQNLSLEVWNRVMNVNITGVFLCCREVVKYMLERNLTGSIINISSIAGKNAFPDSTPYCSSKAAVIGFSRSLALSVGPAGINVNAICPGTVETPMILDVIKSKISASGKSEESVRREMTDMIPMRRFQTPDDVAGLCMFLSSEDGKNINAEAINLDGGVVRD